MTIGERIAWIIQENSLKKVEFARRLGIDQSYVTQIIKGNRANPSQALIKSICREFNIDETWLLTGEGNPTPAVSEDNLDQVLREWGLPGEVRSLFLAYRELTDPQKNAVLEFIQKSAEKLASQQAKAQQTSNTDASIEAEARAEAESYAEAMYQQILAEKRAAAKLPEFSMGRAGAGGATA